MKLKATHLSSAIILCFVLNLIYSGQIVAKDKKLTADEVVAAHVKSLGNPELLASLKNRGVSGTASVEFIQGGVGAMAGQSMVLSSGRSLSIILKYGGTDYPGEYLACDGKDVEVATIRPGQRSPLGDFIYRYNAIMKEGLMGGVWSLGWPLADIGKRRVSLKYDTAKIDGKELHQIEYHPKSGMNDLLVKLFFEPDTFHHVRTEYLLRVQGEQALQVGKTVVVQGAPNSTNITSGQRSGTITRDAGIMDTVGSSYYRLVEKFDNFKETRINDASGAQIGTMILPQSYALEYSVEGQGSSFLAHWKFEAETWMHNGNINPAVFKAH